MYNYLFNNTHTYTHKTLTLIQKYSWRFLQKMEITKSAR